ncbi:MAG: isochorismatase [Deltaproteobacteria bacterium]|nr:isochorismatase [Deltaproteobacteria bacterium]
MNLKPELPLPPHFDPKKVGEVWSTPYEERAIQAEEWARTHDLLPASQDRTRVCLLLVDCQNTFCTPGFELFVAGRSGMGAVEDNVRLCRFIYRNLGRLTEISPTMDTHQAVQIFHAFFWVNAKGEHPRPLTVISVEDVERGAWMPNPAVTAGTARHTSQDLRKYVFHYVRELARAGKYALTIWPYHAMLGGIGHALVSAVEEAIFFHNIARSTQSFFEVKGEHMLTEHYSVMRPEVLRDQSDRPIAEKNRFLIEKLLDFDAVLIAGQAKSHCVAWTVDDLLSEIRDKEEGLARKVYLLEDCTSPVVAPGVVDFTEAADAAFGRFADAGMRLVKSTEPMEKWLFKDG